MLTEIVSGLVGRYQATAHTAYESDIRPFYLPCEAASGVHCSNQFENVASQDGPVSAVRDLTKRCPKGPNHALAALVGSTILAAGILPVAFGSIEGCLGCGTNPDDPWC